MRVPDHVYIANVGATSMAFFDLIDAYSFMKSVMVPGMILMDFSATYDALAKGGKAEVVPGFATMLKVPVAKTQTPLALRTKFGISGETTE